MTGSTGNSREVTTTRTWYLDDRPLESFKTEDNFRHRAYVTVLLQTIKELIPPFTVGIFGSWGVGKTSVTNDLRHFIKSSNDLKAVPVVSIDVWKYEGDSLRRQFLMDVQEGLKNEKALHKSYDIISKLYRERAKEIECEPRFSWQRLKSLTPFLLISFAVALFVLLIFRQLGVNAPLHVFFLALVVPILLLLIPEFSSRVVVQSKGTETETRLFSAEQFEQAFEDIVSKARCDKMVILIDNLDRCSHERVVEILGVVKTYLEPKGKKCIFLIPCDDAAIKQHLKSAYKVLVESEEKVGPEKYADEYLRKFFNASIRIGHFIDTEIEPYITALLNRIRLTEGMPAADLVRMVQLIGAAFTENPRRIKQFLNSLTAKYLLVKDREGQPSPIINPPISDKLLFLTKVSIIEAKFPDEFAQFVADDNLYGEVLSTLEQGKATSDTAKKISGNSELRQFLLGTNNISAQNPKAFFHLKQSPQEMSIPNYDEFWKAVRAGDREIVLPLFEKGDNESNEARVLDICSQIKANASNGYFDHATHIIDIACAISHCVPEMTENLAQEVVGTLALYPDIRKKLASLKPDEVFSLIPKAHINDFQVLLDEYIALYSMEPDTVQSGGGDRYALQSSIAANIVRNLSLFSRPQLEKVREATSIFKNPSSSLLLIISSTDEAKSCLVSPARVSKSIQELKLEEVSSFAKSIEPQSQHFPMIEFILRYQESADDAIGELWVKKCLELLELAVKENNLHLEEYVNRCINDSERIWSKCSADSVDRLARLLRERYAQASHIRRLDIVLTLSAMYKSCSDKEQNEGKNVTLVQFVQSEPPEYISRFLAVHADKSFKNLPYHQEVFDQLAKRIVSEGNGGKRSQILTSFLNVNGAKRTDLLILLLDSLMRQPQLQITIPLVREISAEFPKGPNGKAIIAPLLQQILHQSREQLPAPDREALLNLVVQLKEWHTKQIQEDFDDAVSALLTSPDASLRQVGMVILTSARNEKILAEKRFNEILKRVANWLTEQRPQPPEETIMNELDLVIEAKKDILNTDLRLGLIKYLRTITTPQISPAYRIKALKYLASFAEIPRDVLEELIHELVSYAENEVDKNIRNEIEESLILLRIRNMPLERDLWEDFYRYTRSLIADPNPERQEYGRSLNQKMRQITLDAKKEAGLEEKPEEN